MATCVEKYLSRNVTGGESPQGTYIYIIEGVTNETDAYSTLMATAPATITVIAVVQVLARLGGTVEELDNDRWLGTVRYGLPTVTDTGESTYSFDTTGQTQHITQSISTINSYVATGTAPAFGGAIGVTDKDIKGVDIVVPAYAFTETHYIDDSNVDDAYKNALADLTGCVNAAEFRGRAAGEVLFLGATGAKRGRGDWEITFRFAASPNATGIAIGDITGIAKNGWDYLWVLYEEQEDSTAKALVKYPKAVYVEEVYPEGDFDALEI